jgi:phosphate-selective porin O/P
MTQWKLLNVSSRTARRLIAGLFMASCIGAMGPYAEAVESGRVIEKDGKYVFVESMDPSMKLLLDRALKNGWISQEEYDRTVQESETRSYLLQPSSRAWYDRGFNFSMNDNAFFLKIRARVAMRFTQRFRNDAWRVGDSKNYPELLGVFGDYRANRSIDEASTFNLKRVRLYFMGHLINPDFRYYIQLAGETAENAQNPGSLTVLDANVQSTHISWLNVQLGQFKIYFNRSQINSTAAMQFTDRSLAMEAFTASGLNRRDVGLTIMNDEEVYPFVYYLGVFNGSGPLVNRFAQFSSEEPTQGCPGGQTSGNPFPSPAGCPASTRNINGNLRTGVNQLLYTARFMWNIMGRPGYGEGDLAYSEAPQMAVGGGYAYNPAIETSTNNAFVGIDLANLNFRRQLATLGNARILGQGKVDFSTWTLDYVFKYRGFSLQAEYWFRNVIRHNKGLPCLQTLTTGGPCTLFAPGQYGNMTGWTVQSGYYLIPRKLEIAARYAWWDPDTHSGGDLIKEVNVSLNWFLFGTYDHQIMLTYSNVAMGMGGFAIGRSAPLPAVGNPALPASFPSGNVPLDLGQQTLVENAVRIQYQIFF